MIQLILLIFLTLFTAFFVDLPSASLVAMAFLAGKGIAFVFDGNVKKRTADIYGILFLVGWVYMLMCYVYMVDNGYDWLFAFDTYNAFIPNTEKYISEGNGNLMDIYRVIFEDYDFFNRNEYFYWVYSSTWGVIIMKIGGTLYFGMQTSTLFIYAFVGVILYKLCLRYGFDAEKSYRHTLVICILSIIFFYSSQVLRDIHILLCYLIVFYLAGKPKYSTSTAIILVFVIFITCGIRIESGLFLLVNLVAYLLLTMQEKKQRIYAISISIGVLAVVVVLLIRNFRSLQFVFQNNYDFYMEGIEEGSGMISLFQRIPIIGDIISIIYNASQPIPCWSKLIPQGGGKYGANAANIMCFTRIPAAFFNVMTYMFCFICLFDKQLRPRLKYKLTKAHRYQLWTGIVFLYLQSAVMEQRRLLGYYCVFYLLMFLVYDNISKREREMFLSITIVFFIVLQLIGVFFFR